MSEHWAEDAVAYINRTILLHTSFLRAIADLRQVLFAAQPGEVIVLIGPSRVGKIRALVAALQEIFGPSAGVDPRSLYVIVEAANTASQGAFSTKDFMERACAAIGHPVYGMSEPGDPWEVGHHRMLINTPERLLRRGFECGLRLLGTRYSIFDEAQHIGYAGSDAAAARILNSWKCLASETRTVLVLVGTYELLEYLTFAPHVPGRTFLVHFPRYRDDCLDDIQAFEWVVNEYDKVLKLDGTKTLRDHTPLLLRGSIGCTGQLNKWVRNALAVVQSRNLGFLTEDVLVGTRFPDDQLTSLYSDAEEGEKLLARFAGFQVQANAPTQPPHGSDPPKARRVRPPSDPTKARRARPPFRRHSRRSPRGGR